MNRSMLSLGLCFAWACGTETGNGTTTIRLGLSAESGAPRGTDAQGTPLTVESARTFVRHIEFQLPDGKNDCGELPASNNARVKCDSSKIRVNGPFVVDLLTREATPSLADVEIPAGTYRRVDVRLEDAKKAEAVVPSGDPLEDETLVASGRYDPAGMNVPYDLALKFNEDVRFENPAGIPVESDGAQDVLLDLDVALWFSALPITGCIQDGDLVVTNGRLLIEDKGRRCATIETSLKDAIKSSGQLDRKKK